MVLRRMSISYNFYKSDKEESDDKWEGQIMEVERINNKRIPYNIW